MKLFWEQVAEKAFENHDDYKGNNRKSDLSMLVMIAVYSGHSQIFVNMAKESGLLTQQDYKRQGVLHAHKLGASGKIWQGLKMARYGLSADVF